ncbi:hypothetical protein HG531_003947 [Fusarium graminearum]|nr:hypothetical protein HG531_003947 [Fusarium graminearum]
MEWNLDLAVVTKTNRDVTVGSLGVGVFAVDDKVSLTQRRLLGDFESAVDRSHDLVGEIPCCYTGVHEHGKSDSLFTVSLCCFVVVFADENFERSDVDGVGLATSELDIKRVNHWHSNEVAINLGFVVGATE